MWEVAVFTVGKPSDEGHKRSMERYASMVNGEWRVNMTAVPSSRLKEPAACRREEARALMGRLPKEAATIALDASGRAMDSESFGRFLAGLKDGGKRVAFLIGGAHGLDRAVLDSAWMRLSLSPMTLPHELAAVVLLEQIFRASALYSGRAYAK